MFDDFDTDEVFNSFAKILKDEGHLNKKANYVIPRSLLDGSNYSEISIDNELRRIATENGGNKLYGLFTEDVMGDAHPEGSTKIVDAADGLGEVETLQDSQDKMKEVAEKKMKLARLALSFASDLDDAGFNSLAQELDAKVAAYLGKPLAKKAELPASVQQTLVDLSQMTAQALDNVTDPTLKQQYKQVMDKYFASATSSEMGAKQLPKNFFGILKHLSSLPSERAAYEELSKLSDAVNSVPRAIQESYQPQVTEELPGDQVEPGVAKTLTNEEKMLMVQQKLNQMFPDAGVPENGFQGESKTWEVVRNRLGLTPGKDFKNYDQLLDKMK